MAVILAVDKSPGSAEPPSLTKEGKGFPKVSSYHVQFYGTISDADKSPGSAEPPSLTKEGKEFPYSEFLSCAFYGTGADVVVIGRLRCTAPALQLSLRAVRAKT